MDQSTSTVGGNPRQSKIDHGDDDPVHFLDSRRTPRFPVPSVLQNAFTMTVVGIAILGKSNEPMYLCDCTKFYSPTTNTDSPKDAFGFSDDLPQGSSLPFDQQLLIHSSLDRLDELIGAVQPDGSLPLRPTTTSWLGPLLTSVDGDHVVFGYVTLTSIKFLALCRTPSKDFLVKQLLKTLHEHWITYVLNSFHDWQGPIRSPTLDQRVKDAVTEYQNLHEPIEV